MAAPKFVPDAREVPTGQHTMLPEEGVPTLRTGMLPRPLDEADKKRSGVRPAFTDEDLARIERRERLDTLPAPPDDES